VWKKRKRNALIGSLSVVALLILNSVIGSVKEAGREQKIREAQEEASALSGSFCDEMKTSIDSALKNKTARSLSRGKELFKTWDNYSEQIQLIFKDVYISGRSIDEVKAGARKCFDDAYAISTPPTTSAPRIKSDAEIAAGGNTCAQQWRRARSETLSGGSRDVQLRGTLYACNTFEDWIDGALQVGEYSDGLLDVACLFEPDAPSVLCG
jgi:hypothetical protein